MATAEIVNGKKKEDKKKELPTLASPGVRVPEDLRKVIAERCVAENVSFSERSIKLWITYLQGKKLVPADYVLQARAQGGGGGGKVKKLTEDLVARDNEIAALNKKIADLRK